MQRDGSLVDGKVQFGMAMRVGALLTLAMIVAVLVIVAVFVTVIVGAHRQR